jgi:hypothetical protein
MRRSGRETAKQATWPHGKAVVDSDKPIRTGFREAIDAFRPWLSRIAFPMRAGRAGEGIFGVAMVALVGSVVVAFLYINQSSQVASTGFDIRELDSTRGRLEREEQRLANEGAQLRAFGRVEGEATTRLGMVPAPSPDYVRARRAPIDIDARLRQAEERARSQQPSLDDRVSRWFHLSVIDRNRDTNKSASPAHEAIGTASPAHEAIGTASPAHEAIGTASPAHGATGEVGPPFPSVSRAWTALTGGSAPPAHEAITSTSANTSPPRSSVGVDPPNTSGIGPSSLVQPGRSQTDAERIPPRVMR